MGNGAVELGGMHRLQNRSAKWTQGGVGNNLGPPRKGRRAPWSLQVHFVVQPSAMGTRLSLGQPRLSSPSWQELALICAESTARQAPVSWVRMHLHGYEGTLYLMELILLAAAAEKLAP